MLYSKYQDCTRFKTDNDPGGRYRNTLLEPIFANIDDISRKLFGFKFRFDDPAVRPDASWRRILLTQPPESYQYLAGDGWKKRARPPSEYRDIRMRDVLECCQSMLKHDCQILSQEGTNSTRSLRSMISWKR